MSEIKEAKIADSSENGQMKRDHDSIDDFEHLGDDQQRHQPVSLDIRAPADASRVVDDLIDINAFDTKVVRDRPRGSEEGDTRPVPATPPPSADFEKFETMTHPVDPFQRAAPFDEKTLQQEVDLKATTMAFMETERESYNPQTDKDKNDKQNQETKLISLKDDEEISSSASKNEEMKADKEKQFDAEMKHEKMSKLLDLENHSTVPTDSLQEKSQNVLSSKENTQLINDDSWNIIENLDEKSTAPTKPLPPLPAEARFEDDDAISQQDHLDKYEVPNDFVIETHEPNKKTNGDKSAAMKEKEDEELHSCRRSSQKQREIDDIEIAPKQIFQDMGLDAWFNPERLNPKVAALIYWRDPKKSGIVFGTILAVLLSLAYFSLISVLAYFSLLILTGTVVFRIYKTILQAIQKTSDGHPFKDILDLDLTLPAEKVHEVTDVAIAHANAAAGELRRLFLVEDFVDSVKFGVLLWCLTYVGSWFNGMTLIIIGVVALFTLPKVYETNKPQIDQNMALAHGKINELTTKLKAAIPLGKKAEPTKEE